MTAGGGGRRRFDKAASSLSVVWVFGFGTGADVDRVVDESGVFRFDRATVGGIWGARVGESGSGTGYNPDEPPTDPSPTTRVCLPSGLDVVSSNPLLCIWDSDEKGDVRGGAMVDGGKRFTGDWDEG